MSMTRRSFMKVAGAMAFGIAAIQLPTGHPKSEEKLLSFLGDDFTVSVWFPDDRPPGWTHIALVRDHGIMKTYANGSLVSGQEERDILCRAEGILF